MFDLYQGSETAAHRQAHLLNEVAADRLARSASEGDLPASADSKSPASALTAVVASVVGAFSEAIAVATRRPRWS